MWRSHLICPCYYRVSLCILSVALRQRAGITIVTRHRTALLLSGQITEQTTCWPPCSVHSIIIKLHQSSGPGQALTALIIQTGPCQCSHIYSHSFLDAATSLDMSMDVYYDTKSLSRPTLEFLICPKISKKNLLSPALEGLDSWCWVL